MIDAEIKQALIDEEQLRLLSLGYLISGCISAFFSLFGLLYAGMAVMITTIGSAAAKAGAKPAEAPPVEIAWIFGAIGTLIFLAFVAFAFAKFKVASNIKKRKGRMFCMIVAGVSCLGIPYGIVLGVCTFTVLCRSSVVKQFQSSNAT